MSPSYPPNADIFLVLFLHLVLAAVTPSPQLSSATTLLPLPAAVLPFIRRFSSFLFFFVCFFFFFFFYTHLLALLLNCARPMLSDQNAQNASGPSPCIERNPIPQEECGEPRGRPNRGTNLPVSRQIVYLQVISRPALRQQLARDEAICSFPPNQHKFMCFLTICCCYQSQTLHSYNN